MDCPEAYVISLPMMMMDTMGTVRADENAMSAGPVE